MELAYFYRYIYLIIVTILSFFIYQKYKYLTPESGRLIKTRGNQTILLAIFFIIFIGMRPESGIFVDMMNYKLYYSVLYYGEPFRFDWVADNFLFDNYFHYLASKHMPISYFFITMSIIYFGCSYIGIKRLFPNHSMAAYLVFLAAFSTFSYATNGIKAGAAASIFIMALGYMDKKIICLTLAFVSLGFHHSMQLPIAALIFTFLLKNPKWFFFGWGVCLLMAILHITYFQNLFGGMTDEQGASYLIVQEDNTAGGIRFRPDFILYSAIPIWIGYQYEMKKKLTSKIYSTLLHFYLVTNAVWMLCMYASFNNRVAYLSWFIYPIVIIYPYLYIDNSEKKYVKFSKAVKYHLYFTLFMFFIYYGLFSLGH